PEVGQRLQELETVLMLSHALRINPDASLVEILNGHYQEVEAISASAYDRFADDSRRGPFLGAINQFAQEPTLTVDDLKASMPMVAANPKMEESLIIAKKIAQLTKVWPYLNQLSQSMIGDPETGKITGKHKTFPVTFETSWKSFLEAEAKFLEPSFAKAKDIAARSVSYQHILSNVRIFEHKLEPISDERSKRFDEILKPALSVYKQQVDAITSRGSRPDAGTFGIAAEQVSDSKSFVDLVDHCFEFGPGFVKVFQAYEKETKRNLSMFRAFVKRVVFEVHAAERASVRDAFIRYADALEKGGDGVREREEINALVEKLDFRALGGLREIESLQSFELNQSQKEVLLDEERVRLGQLEGADPQATAKKEFSQEEAKAIFDKHRETILKAAEPRVELAKAKIAEIIDDAIKLEPQIKVFFDKKTGDPRPNGEAVRDPEIARQFSRDLYVILQDVDIKERFGNGYKADVVNYRIFVKPGMNIGLSGLIVMILGSFFALLPTRRAARNRIKAKKVRA
ncbi:MAG: hypothetical protein KDB07_09570, partial [Planctomycetes bacterium]|nr:hypothetical protein [Planctomycetota bacterium]